MRGLENSLQLFLTGFTAADIADPLLSFDDAGDAATIESAMHSAGVDVASIRHAGAATGWVLCSDLATDKPAARVRPFEASAIIDGTTPLHDVVQGLNNMPYLFVRSLGQIGGVIRRSDIQKPPMRMWLFGLITISELRVTQMIDELCPDESWAGYLSEGRLKKAQSLQHERNCRGQARSLLDCLQFADKGQIVARDERLRRQTRFSSRREVDQFVSSLQDLRNNLAHAQDISNDWDVIFELATNLYRIVLGPPGDGDSHLPSGNVSIK